MSLSRKHYQAVAEILKSEREDCTIRGNATAATYQAVERLEDRLCAYFQSDNPNFKPDTFRKAAQP